MTKTISEILDEIIFEILKTKYEISEFHLGETPYSILKLEAEGVTGVMVDIWEINPYRGYPVILNNSNNDIICCLKIN